MRKIGTITSALGLIFFGVWMILRGISPQYGEMMFRWWPAIIIVLGLEIYFLSHSEDNGRRPGLNLLVIPIIIIFMCVSAFQGIAGRITNIKWNFDFDDIINWEGDIGSIASREIKISHTLSSSPKEITFDSNNIELDIKRSTDDKFSVEGSIFVRKSYEGNTYEIKEKTSGSTTTLSFKEAFVRKIKLTAYVPENISVELKGDNIKFAMEKELRLLDIRIYGDNCSIAAFNAERILVEGDNCKVELGSIKNVQIECDNLDIEVDSADKIILDGDNSSVELKNVTEAEIKSNNPSIRIEGNTERLYVRGNNGSVELDNNICRDIDIDMNNTKIDIETKDQNLTLDAIVGKGYCKVNEERITGSNFSKKFGNGDGRVRVKMNNGSFEFSNQK